MSAIATVLGRSPSADPVVTRELRLTATRWHSLGAVALWASAVLLPLSVGSDLWLTVLVYAGVATIAVAGLNLLQGIAGELSLGHAVFVAVGAYAAYFVGDTHGQPLLVWLLAAAAAGGVVGALVAPVALRIRGPYLIVVTLGLLFTGTYVFDNWRGVTGGSGGSVVDLPLAIGPLDFSALTLGSTVYSRAQGLAVLSWLIAGAALVIVKNISRSRSGRAMLAMRDNDLAAEVVGVSLFRAKAGAFVVSSMLAGLAGGLFVAQLQFVLPSSFNLDLSVQYLAMLVIGGTARTFGPVVGALVVGALPQLVTEYGEHFFFVKSTALEAGFGITVAQFSVLSYGGLLVLFLIFEPDGFAGLAQRLRRRLRRPDKASSPSSTP
ncbi:branched-chain amino acid ABC transporter permease [Streptomyces sp. Y7]|uniref:branched-chain amino acid ABC transporter permease n=1 Tax=Streptomyces sp. Y7 TaxID=3342392 RepID=UPI00371B2F17